MRLHGVSKLAIPRSKNAGGREQCEHRWRERRRNRRRLTKTRDPQPAYCANGSHGRQSHPPDALKTRSGPRDQAAPGRASAAGGILHAGQRNHRRTALRVHRIKRAFPRETHFLAACARLCLRGRVPKDGEGAGCGNAAVEAGLARHGNSTGIIWVERRAGAGLQCWT